MEYGDLSVRQEPLCINHTLFAPALSRLKETEACEEKVRDRLELSDYGNVGVFSEIFCFYLVEFARVGFSLGLGSVGARIVSRVAIDLTSMSR